MRSHLRGRPTTRRAAIALSCVCAAALAAGPASSASRPGAAGPAELLLGATLPAGPARPGLIALPRPRPRAAAPRRVRRVHPVAGAARYGEAIARFGVARPGHVHTGQDVFAAEGTPLVAVEDGRVIETGSDGGRGNYLALYGRRSRRTYLYFHMLAPARVRAGARVHAGARLGRVGCTGRCFGAHLHFEVHRAGRAIDPLPLLRRWARARSSARSRRA